MSKAKTGIYAAALTPFQPDGGVDHARLAEYCGWLLAQGLDGVAPLGTTGEGNSISLTDRCRVPETLAGAGIDAARTIIGTGSSATGDAIQATKSSVAAGYNNVLVLPPFYYKGVSDDGIHAYYAKLIESVGSDQLRVYLYHFPQMSMTPFSVELVQRLKSEFGPIIAGLKDSSGDLDGSIAFANACDDFDVYPSNEGVYLDAMEAGCAGIISATTNASAPHAQAMKSTDSTEAQQAQKNLAAIRAAVAKYPLSAALKEIQAARSGDASWREILPPQMALSDADASDLLLSLMSHATEIGVAEFPDVAA